jgi:DNA processing protein
VNVRTIRPRDLEWPTQLSEMEGGRPPDRLHVVGAQLDCGPQTIAIVGTRRPTIAGVDAAEMLSLGLAQAGFTVVSGLAVGIDAVAHKAALAAGGRTVAVLGCGLDIDYPKRNQVLKQRISERGTLVSEYRSGIAPTPFTFPERNRIIAGLSMGVVVVEGGLKSGALITARQALDANRFVFAVPGSIRNPMAAGPNLLIRTSQASLVTDVKHICDELAPDLVWDEQDSTSSAVIELGDCERDILEMLDDVPASGDQLCSRLDHAPGEVAMALSRLEVRNLVLRRSVGYEISTAGARARAATPAR